MKDTIIAIGFGIIIFIFFIGIMFLSIWFFNQTKVWEKEGEDFKKQIEIEKQRCLDYGYGYYVTWDKRINCINNK